MTAYSKLSALLTAANTKTGESDTTLTDAVQTLIDGYGGGGGGGSGLVKTYIATTASEMTLQDFLAANPVSLKYRSGVVLLTIEASTAPTKGTSTANFILFFYSYANSTYTNHGMITSYKTGLDSPNNMNINTAVANAGNFFDISNDCITSNNSTNKTRYFPAGAVFSKIDIPFDLATRTIDETEV